MRASPDFQRLFEGAPGLYLVLLPDYTIVAVSDAYLRATMTERGDIVGRCVFDVFPDNPNDPHASGVANLRASLERVLVERQPDAIAVQKYDIRRPEAEGGGFEERYWSPVNSPVFGADGGIAYIIHRVEDVTEFVRLKEHGTAQDQVAEELRTRAGAMEAEIYRRARQIQEANQQLRQLQADLEMRVLARTAALQQANDDLQREIAEHRKTEAALRKSEEQLRQAQKLEAVGRLAGGIAHDFNNLLTVILGLSEMRLEDLKEADPVRSDLIEIRSAGQQAANLTRQLLAFSRQQVLDPAVLDLNEIVSSLHKMLDRVLGEDVELRTIADPTIGSVRADRGQIEQVLMNLVVNARDAMPDGGTLTIETASIAIGDAQMAEHAGVPLGTYVVVAVRDTGTGMDGATQSRIFEPFFTTKQLGRGTGLGLSTVFGIVKQSGGNICVRSEVGVGTTFTIYLPVVADTPTASQPAVPFSVPTSGTETLLLVEDEDQVRHVATSILRKAGYRVLDAPTAAEAILLARRHPGPIDLLVTDVVMPKMNGRELAERVRSIRAGIKVLFVSGYTDDAILHHGVLDAGMAFVQKPLTAERLTRKVRQVLDAAAAPASR